MKACMWVALWWVTGGRPCTTVVVPGRGGVSGRHASAIPLCSITRSAVLHSGGLPLPMPFSCFCSSKAVEFEEVPRCAQAHDAQAFAWNPRRTREIFVDVAFVAYAERTMLLFP